MKRALSILGILLLSGMVALVIWTPRWQMKSACPSGEGYIEGVPLKIKKPKHPLCGALRISWMNNDGTIRDVCQTSLQVTRRTRLEWLPQRETPGFVIHDGKTRAMVWKLKDGELCCVEGRSFLVDDPLHEDARATHSQSASGTPR